MAVGPSTSETSHVRIVARERRDRALTLRRSGLSYRLIGRELDISTTHANRIVLDECKRLDDKIREATPAIRRLELERLDALLLRSWNRLEESSQQATRIGRLLNRVLGRLERSASENPERELSEETLLRMRMLQGGYQQAVLSAQRATSGAVQIADRRAKLLGLDAPQEIVVDQPRDVNEMAGMPYDAEIAARVNAVEEEIEKRRNGRKLLSDGGETEAIH